MFLEETYLPVTSLMNKKVRTLVNIWTLLQ